VLAERHGKMQAFGTLMGERPDDEGRDEEECDRHEGEN
jgi:hypothetical protein